MNLVTNLLGKQVSFRHNEKWFVGEVCAIYLSSEMQLAIIATDGQVYSGISPNNVKLAMIYYEVSINYMPERKIFAIKAVRDITGMSVAEAKVLAESGFLFKLPKLISHANIENVKRVIVQAGLVYRLEVKHDL